MKQVNLAVAVAAPDPGALVAVPELDLDGASLIIWNPDGGPYTGTWSVWVSPDTVNQVYASFHKDAVGSGAQHQFYEHYLLAGQAQLIRFEVVTLSAGKISARVIFPKG